MNVRLPVVAALVHVVFLHAAFDVYFISPLVEVNEYFSANLSSEPAARRLVLFVADGLRADKCLDLDDSGQPRMAFLRSVIEQQGAWGLSHGRAPTETRAAHVTLLAGFYEDPAGILKGWKENPVPFDTVFNKSGHSWCWGSSQILPLFLKGVTDGRVTSRAYGREIDDMAHFMPSRLDSWVFEDIEGLFKRARIDPDLAAALQQERTVFFLHLLAIDAAGHDYSPLSKTYLDNVKLVDEGIRKVTSLIEDFYGDRRTAFIVTSDHGMTNEGSHGGSRPEETTTPFVAWGAGVRGPMTEHSRQSSSISTCNQEQPCLDSAVIDIPKWKLSGIKRESMKQADMTPLMAGLLGLAFPVNSVGTLHTGLLNMSAHDKAASLLANAQQIGAQLRAKEELVRQRRVLHLTFRPGRVTSNYIAARLDLAKVAIERGEHSESERLSTGIIADALDGIGYYHTYDHLFIWTCVTFSFVGLLAYSLTTVLPESTEGQTQRITCCRLTSRRSVLSTACLALRIVIIVLLVAQSSPWSFYLYALIPTWLWEQVLNRSRDAHGNVLGVSSPTRLVGLLAAIGLCAGLQTLVASFFHREALSLGLLCFVSMLWWPPASSPSSSASSSAWLLPRRLQLAWCSACCILAVFLLLPIPGGGGLNYNYVVMAAGCASAVIYYGARQSSDVILKFQSGLACLAGVVVLWTSASIGAVQQFLPFGRGLCWALLGTSLVAPLVSSPRKPRARLLRLVAALLTVYLTLSTGYESLFVMVLSYFLITWYCVESHPVLGRDETGMNDVCTPPGGGSTSASEKRATFELADLRLCFLFIYLLGVATFGMNDLSSLRGLRREWVNCYVTGYAPFITLILGGMKVVLPHLLVSYTFIAILSARCRDSAQELARMPSRTSAAAFAMTALLSLHFFFLINNEGSWLQIGLSISRYVATLALPFALLILTNIARILTTASLPERYRSDM